MSKHSLTQQSIVIRISGCPNGCARPYLAEIALVGKALGRYNLFIGGDAKGSRLNKLYRENIDEQEILTCIDQMLGDFAANRFKQESFGDYCVRADFLNSKNIAAEDNHDTN